MGGFPSLLPLSAYFIALALIREEGLLFSQDYWDSGAFPWRCRETGHVVSGSSSMLSGQQGCDKIHVIRVGGVGWVPREG